MTKINTKKNILYQMSYEILSFILPIITSPYISRVIGPDGLGQFSYSHSVAYFFVLVSMLGIRNYGNRSIAKARNNQDRLNKTFSGLFVVHAIVSFVAILVYIVYIALLEDGIKKTLAVIQMLYVTSALFDISWVYFGLEQFKKTVTRNIITRILTVVCVFIFVHTVGDLWKYCLIMATGNLISQCILWINIDKSVRFVKVSKEDILIHIPPLLLLFIPTIAVSIYKYMDKIMIANMSDTVQLGFYDNSEKIINIPCNLISAIGLVMLPRISNIVSRENDGNKSIHLMERSIKYIMCFSMGMTFGLIAIANEFSVLFWGNDFEECGGIIQQLCITIPFWSYASIIRTQYLIPREKDREYLTSIVFGAGLNVIVNYLMIPRYGASGAVIGTIGAEFSVFFIQVLFTKRHFNHDQSMLSIVPYCIFATAMYFGITMLNNAIYGSVISVVLKVLFGIIIYGTLCMGYWIITKDSLLLNVKLRISHILKQYIKRS